MNINGPGKEQHTYDAIVIGSGISGGWAAKELTGKGLRTLVLERGREVKHIDDYPTALNNPWDFPHRNRMPLAFDEQNPIATKCYALDEGTQHFFVKDNEHPYVQEKPFDWIKGYQVGGKSLIWARQTQRWSKYDFEANARDGAAIDWPIRYDDIAPWYSHVERFAGISGNKDGLDTLPDGEFLKPWELNCVEKEVQKTVASLYKDRYVIIGRCAHLTEPQQIHFDQGRAQCQARHLCYRGCPFGGYFSSNSSTLPWAAKTGKLTLRPFSVVESILYDESKGKATGVRVVDTNTKQVTEYFARIIFVNAAALNTNLILLNSRSHRFPNGLGNDNGLLGRYVAFHNYRGSLNATHEGFADGYYYGRRPTTAFMPNFRNVHRQETDFLRGYMVAFSASRGQGVAGEASFGAELKENMTKPGPWHTYMMMQGETVPRYDNHVRLSADKKDQWGIPQLVTSIGYTENDEKMLNDFLEQGTYMLEQSGHVAIRPSDDKRNPGLDIHEMGGVRMGHDPKTSLLNAHNQLHTARNVFVTDGAAMTSTSTQNPSITFMALTARAANFAVAELKRKNL
ncbi:GMC oxidoreductase [Fibrella forsythiae]|uniref:GMC family oxidoreductase n=1 Tax=Fibrella forsythiae TaxID=2817061 RepID=A0ABS3JQZ3_9BACT|nr:GMC family oxidoreductase [Fibrella forsythiae]MBO0952431.1 GMC family oxidoreductase [Fibrella forsythiae]